MDYHRPGLRPDTYQKLQELKRDESEGTDAVVRRLIEQVES